MQLPIEISGHLKVSLKNLGRDRSQQLCITVPRGVLSLCYEGEPYVTECPKARTDLMKAHVEMSHECSLLTQETIRSIHGDL